MINILILSCGTNASYHFIKIIKEKFYNSFKIIGVDINPQYLVSSCNYIDTFYQVPTSNSEGYYETIIDICKKEAVNVILPSFDIDQQLFYSENPDLEALNIISLGIPKETLFTYSNKKFMFEFLKKNSFNIPKTYETVYRDNQKYFIKPSNGTGSIGARVISGYEIYNLPNAKDYIIQEICKEPEITVECFYYKNKISTIARERIASKAGVCVKTKIFHSQELENIAKQFAEKLKTPMFFNLQFMLNKNHDFVITDVNLRLAGGMSLSYAVGWDEVSSIANVLLKNDKNVFSTIPQIENDNFVVRAYTDIVTKQINKTVAFDLDGTLLDSRKRHCVVLNDILKKYNFKIDTSDLINYKRNGKNNIDYLISKGVGTELAHKIQKEWIEHIEDAQYLELDFLYSNAKELINKYHDSNLILITARSNKTSAKQQIERLGLTNIFNKIFIVKPDKYAFESKAKILKKENALLMIGDTSTDAKAAKVVGIEFLHIEHGFHKREFINK